MNVKYVVCVFGSQEELHTLNAALTLAEINPQNFHLLHVPTEPETYMQAEGKPISDPLVASGIS